MGDTENGLQSVAIRPLSRGMYRDRIAQLLESGAGVNVQGLRATPHGLETEDCFIPISEADGWAALNSAFLLPEEEFVFELDNHTTAAGVPFMFALTQRFAYVTNNLETWRPVPWSKTFTLGAALSVGSTAITLDDGIVTGHIDPGFVLRIGTELLTIASVIDNTHLTVAAPGCVSEHALGVQVQVYKPFKMADPFIIQYTKTPLNVLFTDNSLWSSSGGIQAFDGSFMNSFIPHEPNETAMYFAGARAIGYNGGRVLLAGTTEALGAVRLRWSSATDNTEFSPDDYVDFTGSQGAIMTLRNIEDYIFVALEDGVAVGQPWGVDGALSTPWVFRPIASGGAAPCGPRAIVSVPSGLIFVGSDDLYTFSPLKRTEKGDYSVEQVKCPVRDLIVGHPRTDKILLRYDPFNSRILVALPQTNTTYNDILSWCLSNNEWSHRGLSFAFTALNLFSSHIAESWDDWLGDNRSWDSAALQKSWMAFTMGYSSIGFVAVDDRGVPYYATRDSGVDRHVDLTAGVVNALPVTRIFETADYDLGIPDDDKTVYKLSMRLRSDLERVDPIRVLLYGSTTKGRAWKALGTLLWRPEDDEAEVHFRLKGNVVRFRFVTSSAVPRWTLEEFVMRLRASGHQIIRS